MFGLIATAESAAGSVLAFTVPTERVLLVRPIVRYGAAGAILLWVFLYIAPTLNRHPRGDNDDESD